MAWMTTFFDGFLGLLLWFVKFNTLMLLLLVTLSLTSYLSFNIIFRTVYALNCGSNILWMDECRYHTCELKGYVTHVLHEIEMCPFVMAIRISRVKSFGKLFMGINDQWVFDSNPHADVCHASGVACSWAEGVTPIKLSLISSLELGRSLIKIQVQSLSYL